MSYHTACFRLQNNAEPAIHHAAHESTCEICQLPIRKGESVSWARRGSGTQAAVKSHADKVEAVEELSRKLLEGLQKLLEGPVAEAKKDKAG